MKLAYALLTSCLVMGAQTIPVCNLPTQTGHLLSGSPNPVCELKKPEKKTKRPKASPTDTGIPEKGGSFSLLDGNSVSYLIADQRQSNSIYINDFKLSSSSNITTAKDTKDAVLGMGQPGSGQIDRLSDNEYARLQKLRQAVKDAEAELAKGERSIAEAHGVKWVIPNGCKSSWDGKSSVVNSICMTPDEVPDSTYEFRGQYLLINVPEASK